MALIKKSLSYTVKSATADMPAHILGVMTISVFGMPLYSRETKSYVKKDLMEANGEWNDPNYGRMVGFGR